MACIQFQFGDFFPQHFKTVISLSSIFSCLCCRDTCQSNCCSFEGQVSFLIAVLCRVWLFATPWTAAHRAPLSMGILQARILKWAAISSSRGSSWPKDWIQVFCIADGWILYHLSHEGSPRIPEWVAYPFSRGSYQLRLSCFFVLAVLLRCE